MHVQKFIKLNNLRSVHFTDLTECILHTNFLNWSIVYFTLIFKINEEEKNLGISTCSCFKQFEFEGKVIWMFMNVEDGWE